MSARAQVVGEVLRMLTEPEWAQAQRCSGNESRRVDSTLSCSSGTAATATRSGTETDRRPSPTASNRQGGGSAWYDSTLSAVGGYSVGDGFLLRMGHGVELSEGDGSSGFGVGYGDGDATERRA